VATQSIISTTLQLLRDQLVDNSYLAHPLFRAIEEHGNLVKVSGGLRIEQPVMFGSHSSISSLSTGFEPVNMAITDPFQTAQYEWANFTAPIVLSQVERAANKGDLAVVNILSAKMKNVMLSLKREVSKQIIAGDSTVLGDIQTLNGMGTAAMAADTTGWFEAGLFGGAVQTNVVGGLSKATYGGTDENWNNQNVNAGATLALSHLDSLFIACQQHHPGGKFPDILLMSPAMFAAFQALQQSSVQYTSTERRSGLDADMVAMWRGARIYVEPQLGFANAGAVPVSGYALSSDMFQLYADTDGFFNVSDMVPVPGTATEASLIFNRMQLTTGSLASQGVILNAEA
tara:strand:- start:1345 stop:2376 length:1032 start_codon:yes stop_codon:yes gene_type:complete